MPSKADMNLVILWEDEIRLAAKAIALIDTVTVDTPEDVKNKIYYDALNVCHAALFGAGDDAAALVLSRAPSPNSKRGSNR